MDILLVVIIVAAFGLLAQFGADTREAGHQLTA